MRYNIIKAVAVATIALGCFEAGKITKQKEIRKKADSYLLYTDDGEILGYNAAINIDEIIDDEEGL
tara:strand:+ start:208 stop:405 length:198 start_codon:yes stop_codon:yes gene_type:complete